MVEDTGCGVKFYLGLAAVISSCCLNILLRRCRILCNLSDIVVGVGVTRCLCLVSFVLP